MDLYKKILQSVSIERFYEILSCTEDYSDESDVLNEFADAAVDMISVPADEMEIGHPEKFKGYFESKMWEVSDIKRYGTFAKDIRLTDAQIVQDLCGYTGGSHTWYFAACNCSDIAHQREILDRYSNCLYNNDIWRRAVRDYLEYFSKKSSNSTLLISVFNPENILESINLLARHKDESCEPKFQIAIIDSASNELEIFEGRIHQASNVAPSFEEVISRHFEGRSENVLFKAHFYAVAEINEAIMEDIGLKYGVRYVRYSKGEIVTEGVDPSVRGNNISCRSTRVPVDLRHWMVAHSAFVEDIMGVYDAYSVNILDRMRELNEGER